MGAGQKLNQTVVMSGVFVRVSFETITVEGDTEVFVGYIFLLR